MPDSGGVFSRVYNWVTDRDASVPITASRMDTEMDGFATALNNRVTRDGSSTVTANLPMGGFIHTGVGAASARTHYARADQVQDDSLKYASTSGTDAYTATLSPAITAYANGLSVYIKFVAANTGAATLNLNSVGAVAIRKFHDVALVSGDIEANSVLHLVYNSTIPCFEIIGPLASLSAVSTYVVGPASATDNAVARFDATTGKLIQDSVLTVGDGGDVTIAGTAATTVLVQGTGGTITYRLDRTDTHGDNVLVASFIGRGRDSSGATQDYGAMDVRAVLDDAGAETGGFEWRTGNAGSMTQRLMLRLGLYTPNATGTDKGADTINASSFYDDGMLLKPCIQDVISADSAVATGTTVLPYDDTIPQNTEGDQYLSVSITPKNTANILIIDVLVHYATSAGTAVSIALFQDSTANALAASSQYNPSNNNIQQLSMGYRMSAGTTSATTFKVRIGPSSAATITFNGISAARLFGGVLSSWIRVREFVA